MTVHDEQLELLPRMNTTARPAPHYMCLIKPEAVAELRRLIPAQTKEAVPSSIGIDLSTWVKIRDGHPVRTGTARRVLRRILP